MKPKEKDYAKFSQLYIVDTENEITNRTTVIRLVLNQILCLVMQPKYLRTSKLNNCLHYSKGKNPSTASSKKQLLPEIIAPLIQMLDDVNPYVEHFRAASDKFKSNADETFHMRIVNDRVGLDGRNYSNPTVGKIAALIPGDFVT